MFVAALNIFKEIARLSTINLAGRMATIDAIVSPRNKYFQLITDLFQIVHRMFLSIRGSDFS